MLTKAAASYNHESILIDLDARQIHGGLQNFCTGRTSRWGQQNTQGCYGIAGEKRLKWYAHATCSVAARCMFDSCRGSSGQPIRAATRACAASLLGARTAGSQTASVERRLASVVSPRLTGSVSTSPRRYERSRTNVRSLVLTTRILPCGARIPDLSRRRTVHLDIHQSGKLKPSFPLRQHESSSRSSMSARSLLCLHRAGSPAVASRRPFCLPLLGRVRSVSA